MGKTDYGEMFAKLEIEKSNIPGKRKVIEALKTKGRILGVKGEYDNIETVLPYCYAAENVLVEPSDDPPTGEEFDVILVGCPGQLSDTWISYLRDFVRDGGYLVTTDWSLEYVVQKAFPGYISHAGDGAGQYNVTLDEPDHPFLEGVRAKGLEHWDVAGGSHLIKIQRVKDVKVLIKAPKLKRSPVMVTFHFGRGSVVHFLSHFHLQESSDETRYVSAFILTNIIEEAIKQKYKIDKPSRVRVLSDIQQKAPDKPKRIKIL